MKTLYNLEDFASHGEVVGHARIARSSTCFRSSVESTGRCQNSGYPIYTHIYIYRYVPPNTSFTRTISKLLSSTTLKTRRRDIFNTRYIIRHDFPVWSSPKLTNMPRLSRRRRHNRPLNPPRRHHRSCCRSCCGCRCHHGQRQRRRRPAPPPRSSIGQVDQNITAQPSISQSPMELDPPVSVSSLLRSLLAIDCTHPLGH